MEHGEHHAQEHHHEEHGEEGAHENISTHRICGTWAVYSTGSVTAATFVIGGLSLAGSVDYRGFWSKDGFSPMVSAVCARFLHAFVFVMLALAAFLTAFYTRQLFMTFFGDRARSCRTRQPGWASNIISITMQLPLIIWQFSRCWPGLSVCRGFPDTGFDLLAGE
jgi:NADH:ubiquinone oxidoreductase subunit 5 (subunit L)/multisubunit Na+/H+ antiporter MnhA subunit